MKIKARLETLEKLNANPTFVNKQLYRLLYNEELYIKAYDHLRSNKGAMTAGISGKGGTADGINMDEIRSWPKYNVEIIERDKYARNARYPKIISLFKFIPHHRLFDTEIIYL